MTLVDELLNADVKTFEQLNTKEFNSERLARLLGTDEAKITLRELKPRRLNDLMATRYGRDGKVDQSKDFELNLMVCSEGIIDPDMHDKKLQEHFDCKTPRELVEKLFGTEVYTISGEVLALSGFSADDTNEDEIKN